MLRRGDLDLLVERTGGGESALRASQRRGSVAVNDEGGDVAERALLVLRCYERNQRYNIVPLEA
jgi:hypothetical protein